MYIPGFGFFEKIILFSRVFLKTSTTWKKLKCFKNINFNVRASACANIQFRTLEVLYKTSENPGQIKWVCIQSQV